MQHATFSGLPVSPKTRSKEHLNGNVHSLISQRTLDIYGRLIKLTANGELV